MESHEGDADDVADNRCHRRARDTPAQILDEHHVEHQMNQIIDENGE